MSVAVRTSAGQIPMARADLNETDIQAVVEVLRSGRLALGTKTQEFEQAFARLPASTPTVNATSLRLARVYGLGDGLRWDEVPHAFARKAATGAEIVLYGGKQRFNLLHLRDAVAAIVFLATHDPNDWEPIYNIGATELVSPQDVAEAANRAARRRGLPGAAVSIRPGDDRRTLRLTSERMAALGWHPSVGMDEAMDELVAAAVAEAAGQHVRLPHR